MTRRFPDYRTNVTGPEVLNYLPRGEAATVRKLLEYRVQLPSGMALRTPEWRRMLGAAASLADPNFDATQYNVRYKTKQDFTSGKNSNNLKSLNTAIGHLHSLQVAADKLDNTDYPMANTRPELRARDRRVIRASSRLSRPRTPSRASWRRCLRAQLARTRRSRRGGRR